MERRAVDQLRRAAPDVLDGRTDADRGQRQSVGSAGRGCSTQRGLELAMESFHHPIALWVVGRGPVGAQPRRAESSAHRADSNCLLRSVVICAGTPKRAIHPASSR